MKKRVLAVFIVAMVAISGCGSSDITDITDQIANVSQATDEHVLGVKNGHPYSYPDITYEQAFENFFGSPTWKYFVGTKDGPDDDEDGVPDYTEDNVDIVEFTGYCTYSDVEVKALLQFTLNKDDDTFEATYLSFNEVPQSTLIMYALLDKAFTEYQTEKGTKSNDTSSVAETSEEKDNKENIEETFAEKGEEESVSTSVNGSNIDYDDLKDTIMMYYAMYYGTNNVAAEVDHEDNDSVTIWLYDPYATTTSSTLGFYEYNKKTGVWTDSVTGELVDFDAAAEAHNEWVEGHSSYPEENYILPNSSDVELTEADLRYLSAKELTYARNEIYARHGYIFKSSELNEYFGSMSWYVPNPNFDGTLHGIEQSNANFIKDYQEQFGLQYKPN